MMMISSLGSGHDGYSWLRLVPCQLFDSKVKTVFTSLSAVPMSEMAKCGIKSMARKASDYG